MRSYISIGLPSSQKHWTTEGIQILIHKMKCFIDDVSREDFTSLCGWNLQYLRNVCSIEFVKYHLTYYTTASIFSEEKNRYKGAQTRFFQHLAMASSTLRYPATETVVNIDQVLALGPIQPVINFPATKFGGRDYRFQKTWYSRYDWLEYSIEKDAMYCFYCRTFGTLGKY